MGDYLTEHSEDLVRGKRVLELGAGGGLPSLVSALEGAAKVCCSIGESASWYVAGLDYV